jgi:hypothetical protein
MKCLKILKLGVYFFFAGVSLFIYGLFSVYDLCNTAYAQSSWPRVALACGETVNFGAKDWPAAP